MLRAFDCSLWVAMVTDRACFVLSIVHCGWSLWVALDPVLQPTSSGHLNSARGMEHERAGCVASSPGPTQLSSVACSTARDGKLGGAWEQGYRLPVLDSSGTASICNSHTTVLYSTCVQCPSSPLVWQCGPPAHGVPFVAGYSHWRPEGT